MHPVYYNNILWPTGPDVSSQILKLFLRVGLEQTYIFSLPAEEAETVPTLTNCQWTSELSTKSVQISQEHQYTSP